MRFKLQDLVIQIIPESDVESDRWGLPEVGACPEPSCDLTCVYCSDGPSDCKLHGSVPVYCYDSYAVNPNPVDKLRSLRALKKHLREHLAAVEAHEAATKANLEPKTLEQVVALEAGLVSALEEVRERKAHLSTKRVRKSKPTKKRVR